METPVSNRLDNRITVVLLQSNSWHICLFEEDSLHMHTTYDTHSAGLFPKTNRTVFQYTLFSVGHKGSPFAEWPNASNGRLVKYNAIDETVMNSGYGRLKKGLVVSERYFEYTVTNARVIA